MDLTPLSQVAGYRWLFAGMFFDDVGRQLVIVAVPFQVFELTGSTLAVGMLGLAQLVPLLVVSLIGGALADAVDRRRLLVVSQLALAATGLGLLWNASADLPLVWPLYVLVAINAGVSAVHAPAHNAITPGLVGRRLLPAALALNQTLSSISAAAVPAFAGFLIAAAGFSWTYGVQAIAFLAGAAAMSQVPNVKTEGGGRKLEISSILEGFRFLRSRRLIQAAFLMDLNAMIFGMPTALFPAFGTEILGGGAVEVGLLYAAPGVGALLGAATSGWVGLVRRHGLVVVLAVVGWGIAVTIFGFSGSLTLSLILLAIAGAADVVSAIFRHSIVQLTVPDELRGRLSAMNLAVVAGGPRLGDVESGVVAALTSVRFSVISGGVACVLGALALARWVPALLRYRYEPDSDGTPEP